MFLLLAIPLWCGFELARRVLREPSRRGQGVMGLGLAIALTLLGVNGIYRLANLDHAVALTLAAELALGALLLRLPKPAHSPWRWSLFSWIFLALIYFFTASQQIANPDDDYWIHTPLQGLLLHGNFPPFNPFFSEIPMNGHYGRNLSLITISYLSGLDSFYCQHLMTCLVQMLTYLILLLALERYSGSRTQALLGAGLMYFGINVGGRGGLMDTLQNNNAYVHLYLALCLHLCLTFWAPRRGATGGPGLTSVLPQEAPSARGEGWLKTAQAVLAGAVLGGYAIVYETHFGLTALAILSALPLACGLTWNWKMVRRTALLLTVAAVLAATQGGPITNIVQRKLSGQKEVVAESLSKGMQNQAQVVKLTVPKAKILQILLERGEYQRISCIYTLDNWLHAFYTPSPGRGYAYIFSWDVLKLHFLPLYLAPWTGWFLWRRRNVAGFWLWTWGAIAFLVPAVVDFGPIYESEYFRWEFASGVGLAGALGVVLGEAWEDSRRQLDWSYRVTPSGLLLDIRKGGWQQLAIGLVLYLDTMACSHFLSERVRSVSSGQGWLHALWLPSSQDWLRSHAVLDFQPIDWQAARWLESQVKPGQRLLTNFRQENNFSILFESTLTGVCGARCVGHALPLDEEAIGTTPFHQAAPAAAFWQTGERAFLDQLMVDWVYYRPGAERPQLHTEGLELAHSESQDGQERQIYRYTRRPVPASASLPHPLALPEGLTLGPIQAPAHVRGGQYAPLKLQLTCPAQLPQDSRIACVPVRMPSETSPAEVEWIQIPLASSGTVDLELPWVAPCEEGDYHLRFLYLNGAGRAWLPGPSTQVAVDFNAWLRGQHLQSMQIPTSAGPEELVQANITLRPPTPREFTRVRVLGCLAPVILDGRPGEIPLEIHRGELFGDLYQLPGIDLQELPLTPALQGDYRLQVVGVLPKRPGRYRLDLFLSPEQGQLYRYPGAEIEVKP